MLEFALKCSVLVFSIDRLGSYQRIIIVFFNSILKLVTEAEVVHIYKGGLI